MKKKAVKLLALTLALSMAMSLLNTGVWAAEISSTSPEQSVVQSAQDEAEQLPEAGDGAERSSEEELPSAAEEGSMQAEEAVTEPSGEAPEAEAPPEASTPTEPEQPEEQPGAEPVLTLNESDPFEFATLKGKKLLLQQAESYPAAFDLRDEGCVTPVKFQNPFGSCWGFAAIGAAESSILGAGLAAKEGAQTLDLSEKHLAYFAASYLDFPSSPQHGEGTHHWEGTSSADIIGIGGVPLLATNAFASGIGPVYESLSDSYRYRGKAGRKDKRFIDGAFRNFSYSADDDWSLEPYERFIQSFVLSESYMLPSPSERDEDGGYLYNPAGTAAIKEQLLNKRGVEIGFCADTSSPNQELGEDGQYMSTKNWAQYTWRADFANHAVEIVGWDDNYPRENFPENHQPPEDLFPEGRREGATGGGNGAWLVKNSWGSGEEQFPNRGEGNWGLLKGQDKGVYNAETGKFEYTAEQNAANTGYFWLSYYDQTIESPEALSFDKATPEAGYYLDQHDFMQVHFMWASGWKDEAKMANVFQAEVCQQLNEVSCQTTKPDTHVTYEIYLLPDNYFSPEDGLLVASMEADYHYGGFHKMAVRTVDAFGSEKLVIQQGQFYSIVVTQRTADGKYAVSTPVGYGDETLFQHYDVGIINPGESFVMVDGEWWDYSSEDVRNTVFDNPGIETPAFDNFPIKGFCTAVSEYGKDLEIRLNGTSDLTLFRGKTYDYKLRFTGGSDAEVAQGTAVRWSLAEGGDAIVDLSVAKNSERATLTPKAPGNTYLIVTVDGVGTSVKPISVVRCYPLFLEFQDSDEYARSVPFVYTGKAIRPEVRCYASTKDYDLLEEGKEYTLSYRDNVKCGAGVVSATGAGEVDPEWPAEALFPIVPPKASIRKLSIAPGQITLTVKDQKKTGLTGYVVQYRPKGTGKWKSKQFPADQTELTLTGLNVGKRYEIQVAGYVDIPEEHQWVLDPSYTGEADEAESAAGVLPKGTKLSAVRKGKKSLTVHWKKRSSGTDGYQIQYSTSKGFGKDTKTVTVSKTKTSCALKNLKGGKKYYVRIRTCKSVRGQELCSSWSGAMAGKTTK